MTGHKPYRRIPVLTTVGVREWAAVDEDEARGLAETQGYTVIAAGHIDLSERAASCRLDRPPATLGAQKGQT